MNRLPALFAAPLPAVGASLLILASLSGCGGGAEPRSGSPTPDAFVPEGAAADRVDLGSARPASKPARGDPGPALSEAADARPAGADSDVVTSSAAPREAGRDPDGADEGSADGTSGRERAAPWRRPSGDPLDGARPRGRPQAVDPTLAGTLPLKTAADIVEALGASARDARRAFLAIAKAPRELIPDLIGQVTNPLPSHILEFEVPVLHEDIAKLDERDGLFVYYIRGMGAFELDDIVLGRLGRGAGTRARIRNLREPFSIGLIIRAALLRRFQSTRYPELDDRGGDDALLAWWREYHRLAQESL